jgi:hypothetical protein
MNAKFLVRQFEFQLFDTQGGDTSAWDILFAAGSPLGGLDRSVSFGTGSRKINKGWYTRSTLNPAGNDDWIIGSPGGNCLDRYKNVVSFALLKWFLLRIINPAAGDLLNIGAAPVNPWVGWFGSTTQTETANIMTFKINDLTGWTVNPNDTLRIHNGTGNPLTYDILALGEQ